jgi:2-keto-4-pentenoate hydratase/2-oxohepta-3-ene-1,7-dioic acid hydratase in catechol pathway
MKIAQFYIQKERIIAGLVKDNMLYPFEPDASSIDLILNPEGFRPSSRGISMDEIRFAPAVSSPSKIIGIGLNYLDHIKESKGKMPKNPIIFAKFSNTLLGDGEDIIWSPDVTNKVDFEAELAVIIGRKTYRVSVDNAFESVFGYCCSNDVSARDLQFGDGQWVRGKSLNGFCPLGPWIVTRDEIPDPHALTIRSYLNGELMQDSNTGMMIFKIPDLIEFISRHITLDPGDVILTGTPHGVGTFRDPSIYMKNGDEIVIEIEKIGRLKNRCRTI